MIRKSVCALLAAFLLLPALWAGDTIARTDDGRIAVLHEESNTFEFFTEEVPSSKTGYAVDPQGFLGIDWESASLSKLGNVIHNGPFSKLYTLGSFYLLELVSKDGAASAPVQWEAPVLKLADGTTVEGFSQSLKRCYTASGSYRLMTGKEESKTVYNILFEVPKGGVPAEVGFAKKVDTTLVWKGIGEEGPLE